MESLCSLLRGHFPAQGDPVPLAALYAANTCTMSEFVRESKRLELESRRSWAEHQRRVREDMAALEWAASHGEGPR